MNESRRRQRGAAQSLGDLQQRLATIDKAQENITKLSGDVLSLRYIIKQTNVAHLKFSLMMSS